MSLSSKSKPTACPGCGQDIIRDCNFCLYCGENGHCFYSAIEKLVIAGANAGLRIDQMIALLNTGMTLPDLITYIDSQLARRSS